MPSDINYNVFCYWTTMFSDIGPQCLLILTTIHSDINHTTCTSLYLRPFSTSPGLFAFQQASVKCLCCNHYRVSVFVQLIYQMLNDQGPAQQVSHISYAFIFSYHRHFAIISQQPIYTIKLQSKSDSTSPMKQQSMLGHLRDCILSPAGQQGYIYIFIGGGEPSCLPGQLTRLTRL